MRAVDEAMRSRGAQPDVAGPMSWAQVYREHHARIEGLCRMLTGNGADAEEVAQEVFLALHRHFDRAAENVAWGPWLTRVAVNACRDRRRSRWWRVWRESSDELVEEAHAAADATPEEAAVSEQQREMIWQAFRKLSARQREVFALRQIEGWSTEETAAALGVAPGSVKCHLSRAVLKLRAALGGAS